MSGRIQLCQLHRGTEIQMAAAKWQQANGARKSAKTDGQKRSETDSSKSVRKRAKKVAKTVENKRKQAKNCENDRGIFL